jgi:hypothetical protein
MTYQKLLQAWGGNASALARELGVTRATVAVWKKRGIPMSRMAQLQRLMVRKVSSPAVKAV